MIDRVSMLTLQGLPELPMKPPAAEGGFAEALEGAIRGVEASQQKADAGLRGVASGQDVDLHGTMIALEEANISLRTMASVRDKVVDAYQTIWNMQI